MATTMLCIGAVVAATSLLPPTTWMGASEAGWLLVAAGGVLAMSLPGALTWLYLALARITHIERLRNL
ncbi:hypothetical protein AO946_09190 [Pseudomonas aeruginosa]|nr:hypothetical protein AO946_09190 [Pseudomonas aeruginosa]PBN23785.1 hypothetical protein B8B65_28585 [Pseudomonas aeruginosa]RPS13250.1 hypothetical protein IPC1015_33260 [Pseudomonas aeruginosa]